MHNFHVFFYVILLKDFKLLLVNPFTFKCLVCKTIKRKVIGVFQFYCTVKINLFFCVVEHLAFES